MLALEMGQASGTKTTSGEGGKAGIPHKGWTCVSVDDPGVPDAVCKMCGTPAVGQGVTVVLGDRLPAAEFSDFDSACPMTSGAGVFAQAFDNMVGAQGLEPWTR